MPLKMLIVYLLYLRYVHKFIVNSNRASDLTQYFDSTQQTLTCLKSTKDSLEKDEKCVQSYEYKQQIDVIAVVLVFLLLILNIFHTFL